MNYLQYLLRAKGRHGTHSPFIYKLVEDALHEQPTWKYPKALTGGGNRKSLQQTLFRVLLHLNTGHYLNIDEEALLQHSWLKSMDLPFLVVGADENLKQPALLLVDAEKIEFYLTMLNDEQLKETIIVVMHEKNAAYPMMTTLFKDERFNCTAFTWNFSILLQSNDFKRKQHFVLR